MGFLSAYGGTVRVELAGPAGEGPYWAQVKKSLSGAELDVAEGKRIQVTATGSAGSGGKDAQRAKARAAARRLGVLTTDEDEEQAPAGDEVSTAVHVDQAAYRLELLTLAVVDWNLTDEHDAPLPLAPGAARRRSLQRLPSPVYNLLVETVEANLRADARERDEDEQAAFRG